MVLTDFKLKNYTTEIPAEKSITEIEHLLNGFGCTCIIKEMSGDGKTISIAFKINEKAFKLPANYDGVAVVMFGNKRQNHRRNGTKNREEQAYRTCWRIIRDWLHAQLSLIASGQAHSEQIMLPYMWNGKQTLYESYKNNQLRIEGSDVNTISTQSR